MQRKITRLLELGGLYWIIKPFYDLLRPFNPRYLQQRKEMLNFYSQFIGEDNLCFDIGANLGTRTEIFLELGAKVVTVEPQRACIQRLRKKYGSNKKVILVEKAIGEKEGRGRLMLNDIHILSSMSKSWIKSVKTSGRFSGYKWEKTVVVPMTTLDKLIKQYGRPAFCKIDVEGFEEQVIKGLSQPIKALSFEFVPEFIDSTISCIKHLSRLGMNQFNYSLGEIPRLVLPKWVSPDEIGEILLSLPNKTILGEVYVS